MPWGVLLFLTLINLLNFFDRYIVHAVEPILKSEFVLSNKESGLLGAAFVLGYFLFSPIFGFLGDRIDRRILMAAGLFAWSLFTALTALSHTLYTFIAARALVGIGEASFGAIVPGYLKGRVAGTLALNNALALFYVAIPVGSALGFIAGGQIAMQWGWRPLFLLAALPGIVLAFGFLRIAPERRSLPKKEAAAGFIEGWRRILARPELRLIISGYVLNTFALNGIAMFVVRHGTSLGMSESEVASRFGVILATTGLIGALGGGRLASLLAARMTNQVRGLLLFVSITTLLGAPFLFFAFLATSPLIFFASCFIAQIALFAGVAPLNSALVERAPHGLETLTQGVTIFMIQLFGAAIAPITIGWVADMLTTEGIAGSSEQALAYALQVATAAMVLSGVLWWLASRSNMGEEGSASSITR